MMRSNRNDYNNIMLLQGHNHQIDRHDLTATRSSANEVISEPSHTSTMHTISPRVNDAGAFLISSPDASLFSKVPNQQDDQYSYQQPYAPICTSTIDTTTTTNTNPTAKSPNPITGIIACCTGVYSMLADERKSFVAKSGAREPFPNPLTSSELSNQICVLRRTRLSFMPLCSDSDSEKRHFDVALDSLIHDQASELQPSGPISVPASALLQSPFDPSNHLYSVEFASFAKDYQGRLKELAGQMENSEKSRSKVAMIKMLLLRHEKRDRFTRNLAATRLNTIKSEETRKLLLRTHYFTRLNTNKSEELRAHDLNLNNKASGTRSLMNVTSLSTCNVKPISYAAIKDARRKSSTTRYEVVPAARQVLFLDTTVNFDDVVSSGICSSGMNMDMNLNTQHNINSNPHSTSRRVVRRRSSLTSLDITVNFDDFDDFDDVVSSGLCSSGMNMDMNLNTQHNINSNPHSTSRRVVRRRSSLTSLDITVNFDDFDDVVSSGLCSSGMNTNLNTQHNINSNPHSTSRRVVRKRSSLIIRSFQMQFFPDIM